MGPTGGYSVFVYIVWVARFYATCFTSSLHPHFGMFVLNAPASVFCMGLGQVSILRPLATLADKGLLGKGVL